MCCSSLKVNIFVSVCLEYIPVMLVVTSVLLICICKYSMCLPCLTDESKKSFNDTRKALTSLETYIGETINTWETNLGKLKSDVGSKIKNLNGKLNVLEVDFSSKSQFENIYIHITNINVY